MALKRTMGDGLRTSGPEKGHRREINQWPWQGLWERHQEPTAPRRATGGRKIGGSGKVYGRCTKNQRSCEGPQEGVKPVALNRAIGETIRTVALQKAMGEIQRTIGPE